MSNYGIELNIPAIIDFFKPTFTLIQSNVKFDGKSCIVGGGILLSVQYCKKLLSTSQPSNANIIEQLKSESEQRNKEFELSRQKQAVLEQKFDTIIGLLSANIIIQKQQFEESQKKPDISSQIAQLDNKLSSFINLQTQAIALQTQQLKQMQEFHIAQHQKFDKKLDHIKEVIYEQHNRSPFIVTRFNMGPQKASALTTQNTYQIPSKSLDAQN